MYKHLIKTSTVNMSRDEWLEHRRKTIGGSEAACILGLNPWTSPYSVWAEKLGKLPPRDDNEAMRQGRDLESYVAQRFTEETGKKVRRENNILVNPDYPFAHANVDRMIVGEDAGLECKTTSTLNLKNFKNGAFPDTYYVQCVHYMMVTGCKKWYLAVLVLNKAFMVFEIERDEAEIEALARSEADFWKLVESQTTPIADGSSSTTETINTIFPDADGDSVSLFGFDADLESYIALTKQIKALEALKDEAANKVKSFLENSSRGESDRYRVSWTAQTRQTFDVKEFAKDHPDMDLSHYYKTSKYRTFKVNEIKEN